MLNDLIIPNLKIVFCGTAVGHRSEMLQAYYAGRGNKFWRILFETGLTDRLLKPEEYRQLLDYKLGLTDLVKERTGNDSELNASDYSPRNLDQLLSTYSPSVLCFNGKKAAKEFFQTSAIGYGFQTDIQEVRIFVAPSTSGSANGYWNPSIWQELATSVNSNFI